MKVFFFVEHDHKTTAQKQMKNILYAFIPRNEIRKSVTSVNVESTKIFHFNRIIREVTMIAPRKVDILEFCDICTTQTCRQRFS